MASLISITLALSVTLAVPVVFAQTIDPQRSSIKVTARQMNVPFDGNFRTFAASIAWDDAKPESSKASIEVDLASFDLGDPSFNEEARGKSFLDAAKFSRATFTTSSIRSVGSGRYEATGKLGIKGVTRDVTVPFSVKDEAGRRVFESTFPLKRLDYRIGEGEWSDTKTLANETTVHVRLVATSAR